MLLKTTRLILRPQIPADAAPLFDILSDAQAMRFWSRPPMTELAVANELVHSVLKTKYLNQPLYLMPGYWE